LFKYKYNPFYVEEYETKSGTNYKGEPYVLYTVPVSEMCAVLKDGTEITHSLYEKRKTDAETKVKEEEVELPKLQSSLFPNFDEEFPSEKKIDISSILVGEDALMSDMTISDFAAIMWKQPVSNKLWLNSLINKL
jgi:hypothetical protein